MNFPLRNCGLVHGIAFGFSNVVSRGRLSASASCFEAIIFMVLRCSSRVALSTPLVVARDAGSVSWDLTQAKVKSDIALASSTKTIQDIRIH